MRLADSPYADADLMDAARRWLNDHSAPSRTAVTTAMFDPANDAAAWASLVALGWTGLRLPEAAGGSAAGLLQLASLIEASGESLFTLPLLEHSLAIELLLACPASDARDQALFEAAAAPCAPVAWGLSGKGPELRPRTASGDESRWMLNGHAAMGHGTAQAAWWIVGSCMASSPTSVSGKRLLRLPARAAGTTVQVSRGLDGRMLAALTFEGVLVPAAAILARGAAARQAMERAQVIGRLLMCAEACGIARRVLELTIEHLKTRQQFGRPLGQFQVLQHRAADMLIGATYARDMTWDTLARLASFEANSAAGTAAIAGIRHAVAATKLEVMRNVRAVAEQAIQLHGGMGVSDELPVSHAYRRVLVIDALLGSRTELLREMARTRI